MGAFYRVWAPLGLSARSRYTTYNQARGEKAIVGGGFQNNATGLAASVGGGRFNEAAGSYSSVSGGSGDVVTGIYDWRAGDEFFSTD